MATVTAICTGLALLVLALLAITAGIRNSDKREKRANGGPASIFVAALITLTMPTSAWAFEDGATGFSGHGFLQGPAVGEVVRDLYLGREPFLDVAPFSADRFGAGTARPEHNIV